MGKKHPNMVPPDGGWGWVVLLAVNIINFLITPMDTCFGLVFGDFLKELDAKTVDAAIITSGLNVLRYASGLFLGPIFKKVSYRKISIIAGILCSIGFVLTYPARSLTHLFISYSVIYGLGLSLATPTTTVILTRYFVRRRGLVLGFSQLGGPIGMMLVPHLMQFLLEQYGFRGTVLIWSGLALNMVAASCLYQPAKWHFVFGQKHAVELTVAVEDSDESPIPQASKMEERSAPGMMAIPQDGFGNKKATPNARKFSGAGLIAHDRKASVTSMSNIEFRGANNLPYIESECDLPITRNRFSELGYSAYPTTTEINNDLLPMEEEEIHLAERQITHDDPEETLVEGLENETHHEEQRLTVREKIVNFFDFDLLMDPRYINLSVGLALFSVCEHNFKMLAPFFYDSIGFGKKEIAFVLSLQVVGDILGRIALPILFDKLTLSKRSLFMICVILFGACRSVLAEQTDFTSLVVSVGLYGIFRAGCYVTYLAALSDFTCEKLPTALGLHMMTRGICNGILGPILGYIRDATKSYSVCIHAQTSLLALFCISWIIEYTIIWTQSSKLKKQNIKRAL